MLSLAAFIRQPASAEPAPRSINEIVSLALGRSGELSALEQEAAAQHALALQAGTISNPTLELQGASGSLTGSPDEHSVSVGIAQEFPLNSKLRLRRETALQAAASLRHQRENAARLLRDEVAALAQDCLLAAGRQELATELARLNGELVMVAEERFRAGDIPELELNMARVEQARAGSRLLELEQEALALRIRLAAVAGLPAADLRLAEPPVPLVLPTAGQGLVAQALQTRPDLRAAAGEQHKSASELQLAGAETLPNLTAGLFVQWQRGLTELGGQSAVTSDTQLGLRLSMPIPLFDRNQGGRAAARARLAAADSRRAALEQSIAAEVEAALARLVAAQRILAAFEQGIVPQLTENLKLVQEAYRIGEVGLLTVIEEQKKYFEVNDSYLAARHARRAALQKLESAVAADLGGGVK